MFVRKHVLRDVSRVPLIAALPYEIGVDSSLDDHEVSYNTMSQLTVFAGRRDFSTCRCDESTGGMFNSKSDTQKDD